MRVLFTIILLLSIISPSLSFSIHPISPLSISRTSLASTTDPQLERAWRHFKKPLLSIGAKGAAPSHGNSLRQLLEAHRVVKVKVNTLPYKNSLQAAYEDLQRLAEQSGSIGVELVQMREKDRIILFGIAGVTQEIRDGTFPPPPPKEKKEVEEKASD